ncbi:lantibiotic dehydratase [Streptoverticillium reticulum]|uniref:lantibiotic dehydratase n=1 Tax=Streptoverticillium reticulum TaxID=1433415 RepID=UPI0039BFB445
MSRTSGPLYRPLDWLMVRTPLLPVAEYLALAGYGDEWPADTLPGGLLPADPRVRRALAVGGGDLARALERPPRDGHAQRRLSGKLLRYLIRMSTRPTPYGMFAGAALGHWGDRTDLAVAPGEPRTRARPDMGWLTAVAAALELRPDVRAGLRWYANPTALVRGGRVFLAEPEPGGGAPAVPVSLRATGPVRRALELARTSVPYARLLDELAVGTPGATPAKAGRLLEQLWEHTVLLTDLRPPLTTRDPARHMAQRLAGIPAARADAEQLLALLEEMSTWDRLPAEEGAAGYPELAARARSAQPAVPADAAAHPVQVDMAVPLAARHVGRAVAAEAARAAELLLRLSPAPGAGGLDAYRQAFRARYGPGREVPLLELLDPETGLGPPGHVHGSGPGGHRQQIRSRTLQNLALEALRDHRTAVELDAETLSRLETWTPAPATAPISLDLSVFVLAASAEAVDAGDFTVVVGPNLGGPAAGRNLGRFADLLGPDAEAALRAAAAAEAAVCPGRLWAEVVYRPRRARSANVAVRPPVRDHELALGTVPGGPAEGRVPVRELVVGLHDDRFTLRWPARDLEVTPCAGHMLNTRHAPAVARFLDDVSRDGRGRLSSFDWGPAAGFPFLPRVQAGRAVLAPATWRLDTGALPAKSPEQYADSIAAWRDRWQVPRHVYLAAGDNRLLLDLDAPAQADQLRAETARLPAGGTLLLQEALPGPEHAWLPGPDGCRISEFVVPLVLRTPQPHPAPRPPEARPQTVRTRPPVTGRLRAPGSDWLFAKLYCPPAAEEDLIAGPVRAFCTDAVAAGLATDWFFLRYTDPDPHLRIRLHGDPGTLAAALAPQLFAWAAPLIEDGRCRRLCIDTYDREVERYGGPAAMPLAEALFGVDSTAVADLLHLAPGPDRTLLAVRTVDDLLAALGLDEAERLAWYRERSADRRAGGRDYRARQVELRAVLTDPGWPKAQPGGAEAADVLARRRTAIEPLARRLQDLAASGELWHSPGEIARSHVHLHCNRLLGIGRAAEQEVLGLLLRTRESLRHVR